MSERLLEVKGLAVSVEGKQILHGIDLCVERGETHVLMGPNGAGKSTLGNALMGNPRYEITAGKILFRGKEVQEEPADKRAQAGMFLSFQNPLEVPGLPLGSFIRSALEQRRGSRVRLFEFRRELERAMDLLQIDRAYAQRDLNAGFSGGEKKKAEILQMLLLKPALAILDETDSGLDVDAVRTVSGGVEEYQSSRQGGLLIITHSTRILDALQVDRTHIMVDGRIVKTGGAALVEEVNRSGFEEFLGGAAR
ncbi:MAG: Fe-S cluster assembly ATPase SufC [Ruthenibacterium sp.]